MQERGSGLAPDTSFLCQLTAQAPFCINHVFFGGQVFLRIDLHPA